MAGGGERRVLAHLRGAGAFDSFSLAASMTSGAANEEEEEEKSRMGEGRAIDGWIDRYYDNDNAAGHA